MACARCHDHKFDPLSMEDYYGLYGVFASSKELPPLELPLLDDTQRDAEAHKGYLERKAQVLSGVQKKRNEVRRKFAREMRAYAGDYLQAVVQQSKPHRTDDKSKLKKNRTGLRGPVGGRVGGVGRWRTYIDARDQHDSVFGLWHRFAELKKENFEFEAPGVLVGLQADGNRMVAEAFAASPPVSMVEVAHRYGDVFERVHKSWQEYKKKNPEVSVLPDAAEEEIRQVLYADGSPTRGVTDRDLPRLYKGGEGKEFRDLNVGIEKLLADSMGTAPPRAMTVIDRKRQVDAHIHVRGDVARKGDKVPRRFLQVLSHVDGGEPFSEGSGRLELARAIVSPNNPLTPRVIVNRVWSWHFGRGLVNTPSDLGVRGEQPTHPELLDHLAHQFIANGWSLKSLHRAIVNSATYRQASHDRPDCREADDRNTLLWRMNRRRRNYEEMRDALLSSSGELDTRLAGAPFDDLDNSRRTLYQFIDRKEIPRLRLTFDFSVPDATLPKRFNSTVPQQALFLLNDAFVTRRARRLLVQLDREVATGETDDRIAWAYRTVYGREPRPAELEVGRKFVALAAANPIPVPKAGGLSKPWQYGTARYDRETEKVTLFKPIEHFDGRYLSASAESVEQGGAFASVDGGRPGPNDKQMLVRRWTAPVGGLFMFKATLQLKRGAARSDGITAWVVTDRQGKIDQFNVNTKPAKVRIERVTLEKGEQVDFVIHSGGHNRDDEFSWPVEVWRVRNADEGGGLIGLREWPSVAAFEQAGPSWMPSMGPWEQYIQALLISNEFMFVD